MHVLLHLLSLRHRLANQRQQLIMQRLANIALPPGQSPRRPDCSKERSIGRRPDHRVGVLIGKPRQPDRPLVGLAQRRLCASPLGDVMENEHHADHASGAVLDRRRTVLDRHFPAILGDQRGVVGQCDHMFLAQYSRHQILGRLVGLFVDDPENALDRLAQSLLKLPAGQRYGDGIEKGDPAGGIGGHHRVADTAECNPQPLALLTQILFRLLALGNLLSPGLLWTQSRPSGQRSSG